MLVLTLRKGESVTLGDGRRVEILDVGPGGRVSAGFTAPPQDRIHRLKAGQDEPAPAVGVASDPDTPRPSDDPFLRLARGESVTMPPQQVLTDMPDLLAVEEEG